jgi:hypothetical protein
VVAVEAREGGLAHGGVVGDGLLEWGALYVGRQGQIEQHKQGGGQLARAKLANAEQ